MWTITRKYSFAAAHRLEGHPKCGRLHGHNYVVTVGLRQDLLEHDGWIMDYAQLDVVVKPIIEELDHRYIVSSENIAASDPYALVAIHQGDAAQPMISRSTAELLARWIAVEVRGALKLIGIEPFTIFVEVAETEKSSALFVLEEAY